MFNYWLRIMCGEFRAINVEYLSWYKQGFIYAQTQRIDNERFFSYVVSNVVIVKMPIYSKIKHMWRTVLLKD